MPPALATDLETDSLISLNQAKVGCNLTIRELSGPGCQQLRNMGFCESLQVKKLADGRNLLCSICGTRLAVSRELAGQILVSAA